MPIILDNGVCVGPLCEIDTRPRQFNDKEMAALRDLVPDEIKRARTELQRLGQRDDSLRVGDGAYTERIRHNGLTLNLQQCAVAVHLSTREDYLTARVLTGF